MKIAITGGAGFIGAHLTKALLDAGHDVLVIDSLHRGSRQAVDPRARFYSLDVRDSKLRALLQMERPDLISHHVAQWQHDLPREQLLVDADVHIRGLLNVLDSCVNASVKKIILASGGNDIYGPVTADQLPLLEDAPLRPRRPIDISRMTGEWYVRHYTQYYGLKHTILRYADVYGDTDTTRITDIAQPISYFIRMLAEQRRPIIRGSGEEKRDYIFIDDVVRANLCALKQGENQTFHISSGNGYTLNSIYQMVASGMKSEIKPLYLASTAAIPTMALDNTQAQQQMGWQPEVSMQYGIRCLIAQLRSEAEKLADLSSVQYLPVMVMQDLLSMQRNVR
jgi:UDP-glucose 4-epimerase